MDLVVSPDAYQDVQSRLLLQEGYTKHCNVLTR